ncbi:Peptidyl-prolyl cis-trans isomerase [Quillaja saponaria]|uniref:Peptidyl-prolyl cis-trans isomerase n=1 Tax=Quillaja saponaria TaxID=32244 RepID=A0AAD7LZL1_QUISA|nr:Peptidyl-prolyl cis-trans isomerase [Quillaja saponaria]
MATNQVRASHILIKHQGSRRKASWKDPEGRVISNTTKESAVAQLSTLREDIVTGKAKFKDIASRYSDCSSAKHGGDLGPPSDLLHSLLQQLGEVYTCPFEWSFWPWADAETL